MMNDEGNRGETPVRGAAAPWKNAALSALIYAGVTSVVTKVLDTLYKIRFRDMDVFIRSLSVPLLFLAVGILIALPLMFRVIRSAGKNMKVLIHVMLIAALASLSFALAAVLNMDTLLLGSFELTGENIQSAERQVSIPQTLQSMVLKVSGEKEPGFDLELERRSAGNGAIEWLEITGLNQDEDLRSSRYYILTRGTFTVPGPFMAGDTVRLYIERSASFEGKIKLELTGSKN
jgi:hypothetical protein